MGQGYLHLELQVRLVTYNYKLSGHESSTTGVEAVTTNNNLITS